jgi:hypothetical protein
MRVDPCRSGSAAECLAASTFINHLVKVAHTDREPTWKANLRLISGLIQLWGPVLEVDKKVLGGLLTKATEKSTSFLSSEDRLAATGEARGRVARRRSRRSGCMSRCGLVLCTGLAVFAMLMMHNHPILKPTSAADRAIPAAK